MNDFKIRIYKISYFSTSIEGLEDSFLISFPVELTWSEFLALMIKMNLSENESTLLQLQALKCLTQMVKVILPFLPSEYYDGI